MATISSAQVAGPDADLFQVDFLSESRVKPGFSKIGKLIRTRELDDYDLHTATLVVTYDDGSVLAIPIRARKSF